MKLGYTFLKFPHAKKIPRIGQTFESWKDAHDFYNIYAKEADFSIRKYVSHKKNDPGVWIWKKFVCYNLQARGKKRGKEIR